MQLEDRYIRLRSGIKFFPFDPHPDQITIEDIAAALSKNCRWTGHTPHLYTVAEHSLEVAKLLPNHLKMQGLLHDASEAFLSDIAKPVKVGMPDYQALEKRIEEVISRRFRIPYPLHPLVKQADCTMLYVEALKFFPQYFEEDSATFGDPNYEWIDRGMKSNLCLLPEFAEMMFLDAYNRYVEL